MAGHSSLAAACSFFLCHGHSLVPLWRPLEVVVDHVSPPLVWHSSLDAARSFFLCRGCSLVPLWRPCEVVVDHVSPHWWGGILWRPLAGSLAAVCSFLAITVVVELAPGAMECAMVLPVI